MSCEALRRLKEVVQHQQCGLICQQRVQKSGRIEFFHQNMLDADVSSAMRLTVFGTCYTPAVKAAVLQKLLRELPTGARIYLPGFTESEVQLLHGDRKLVPLVGSAPFPPTYLVAPSSAA